MATVSSTSETTPWCMFGAHLVKPIQIRDELSWGKVKFMEWEGAEACDETALKIVKEINSGASAVVLWKLFQSNIVRRIQYNLLTQ